MTGGRQVIKRNLTEEAQRDVGGLVRWLGCTPRFHVVEPHVSVQIRLSINIHPLPYIVTSVYHSSFLLQGSEQVCSWDFLHTACAGKGRDSPGLAVGRDNPLPGLLQNRRSLHVGGTLLGSRVCGPLGSFPWVVSLAPWKNQLEILILCLSAGEAVSQESLCW